jgi:hypothetical protein
MGSSMGLTAVAQTRHGVGHTNHITIQKRMESDHT